MTIDLLPNGSFVLPWTNLLPYGGPLTNQQPAAFALTIRMPGTRLLSADYQIVDDPPVYTEVIGVPECVHKLRAQLPDADALILDGDVTYKMFAATNPFSVDLTAMAVLPSVGRVDVMVPVQVHQHGDGSPGAAVWRMIVNDMPGDWLTFGSGFVDRTWAYAGRTMVGGAGTVISAMLQVESRALAGIDFFTDAWRFEFTPTGQLPADEPSVDYVVVVNLLPQDASIDELHYVQSQVFNEREVVLQSHKDAIRLVLGGLPGSFIRAWSPERWGDGFVAFLYAQGIADVRVAQLLGDELPPVIVPPDEPELPPVVPPPPLWRPRNYVPRGTKLAFHGVGDGGQSSDIFAPLLPQHAAPASAKIVVSLGAAGDILRTGATPAIIGRVIDAPGLGNLEGWRSELDQEWQANKRMAELMPIWAPYRDDYTYWEFINEQNPPTPEAAAAQARYSIVCMEIAEANDYRLALFSHSVGTPEPWAWDACAPTGVFERAAAGGHAIALHEYGDVNLNLGSHLLRYRDVYTRHILPRGLDIPLYITEYNDWRDILGYASPDYLFDQWVRYDALVSTDPYVAGVHIYSVGMVHDLYVQAIYDLYSRFRDYAVSVKDRING